jgi:hypothetical protein
VLVNRRPQTPASLVPGSEGDRVYPATARPRQRPGTPPAPARHAPPREIMVVGAHGGAGVTTLAGLLRPAWDLGVVRRPGPGCGVLRPAGRQVLLVARGTVPAAGRAVAAIRLLGEQDVQVAVLAVVGDGLPEPAEARYRFRVLEGRVGAVIRVPFVPVFRIAADPLSAGLPRRARRALAAIRSLVHEHEPVTRHSLGASGVSCFRSIRCQLFFRQ